MGTHESEGTVAQSEQSPSVKNSYTLAGKYKVNVSSWYINPMLQMGERILRGKLVCQVYIVSKWRS